MTISLDKLAELAKAAQLNTDICQRGGDLSTICMVSLSADELLKLIAVVKAAKAAEHALPHKVRNDTSYPISFQEKADASMAVLREALFTLDTP